MYLPSIIIPEFALIKIDFCPYVVHLLTNSKVTRAQFLSIKSMRIEEDSVESDLVLMESGNYMADMLKINPQADS